MSDLDLADHYPRQRRDVAPRALECETDRASSIGSRETPAAWRRARVGLTRPFKHPTPERVGEAQWSSRPADFIATLTGP